MWSRDRASLFWTFFLPLVIMVIFGLLNFGELGRVDLGIVDQADNAASADFIANLESISALDTTHGSLDAERAALEQGQRDLVIILPPQFGPTDASSTPPPDAPDAPVAPAADAPVAPAADAPIAPAADAPVAPVAIAALYHAGRSSETQVGLGILRAAIAELNYAITGADRVVSLDARPVNARSLGYIDFLMPGVIGMSIMQLGLFSVAFSFVTMKREGVLRRLLATPLHPAALLIAQVITRLLVVLIQTLILAAVAVFLFGAEFAGNFFAVLLAAALGGAVFLALGFAVSGWARSEQQAAPLANIVSLPMMFLSGVFFSRDVLPDALRVVTDYLPLTYLVEAIRGMTVQGDSIIAQWPNFLGLAVWLVVAFIIANRTFRWE